MWIANWFPLLSVRSLLQGSTPSAKIPVPRASCIVWKVFWRMYLKLCPVVTNILPLRLTFQLVKPEINTRQPHPLWKTEIKTDGLVKGRTRCLGNPKFDMWQRLQFVTQQKNNFENPLWIDLFMSNFLNWVILVFFHLRLTNKSGDYCKIQSSWRMFT